MLTELICAIFLPVNLELCDTGLFDQDVPGELGDIGLRRGVLDKVGELLGVCVVDVITHAEELLVIVV